MNAKKAKKLRKLLKSIVSAKEAAGHTVEKASYLEDTNKRKYVKVPRPASAEPSPTPVLEVGSSLSSEPDVGPPSPVSYERQQVAMGQVHLDTASAKGAYRALKKGVQKSLNKTLTHNDIAQAARDHG